MTTTLEKIATREQAIAATADDLRAQIRNLTDRLRDLDAEVGDLAIARNVILALGEDEPTPATHPALPDNPVYQHILTALTGADTPRRARELCRDLDLGTGTSAIEGMRSKLKRLVATGPVTEDAPGLFAVPRPRTTDEAPANTPHPHQGRIGHQLTFSSLSYDPGQSDGTWSPAGLPGVPGTLAEQANQFYDLPDVEAFYQGFGAVYPTVDMTNFNIVNLFNNWRESICYHHGTDGLWSEHLLGIADGYGQFYADNLNPPTGANCGMDYFSNEAGSDKDEAGERPSSCLNESITTRAYGCRKQGQ